jgi:hypothetical protein
LRKYQFSTTVPLLSRLPGNKDAQCFSEALLALLILPINAFVVTLFLLSNVYPDPTTVMPSAVEAAMLILPP